MANSDQNYTITITASPQETPANDINGAPEYITMKIQLSSQTGKDCSGQKIEIQYLLMPPNAKVTWNGAVVPDGGQVSTDQYGRADLRAAAVGAASWQTTAEYTDSLTAHAISSSVTVRFTAEPADSLKLSLQPESQVMGGEIAATAKVVSKNMIPVGNIAVTFQIEDGEDNGSYFIPESAPPDETIVNTDSNGTAVASFTNPVWLTGSIRAVCSDTTTGDPETDQKEYQFTPDPAVTCELNPITAEPPNGTAKRCASAPADNLTTLWISGGLFLKGAPLEGNPPVTLQITDSASKARFADADENSPHQIEVACQTGPNGDNGYFKAAIVSDEPTDTGAQVAVYIDGQRKLATSDPFSFVPSWTGVSNVSLTLASSGSNYSIYANGQHQAAVVVNFKLTTYSGASVPTNSLPEVADLLKLVEIIDYNNAMNIELIPAEDAHELFDGKWGYCEEANSYSMWNLDGGASPSLLLDETTSTVNQNGATLYYYIRCDHDASPPILTVGLKFAPTGSGLAPSGDTYVLSKANEIIFSANNYKFPGGAPCTITAVPPPSLDQGSITCQPTLFTSPHQNDDGPTNLTPSGDYNENFYRQCDYQISISSDFTSRYQIREISYDVNNPRSVAKDYLYSQMVSGFYNYSLYIWPTNLARLKSYNPSMNGAFPMVYQEDYGAKARPGATAQSIYVTRYMSLAPPQNDPETLTQNDISLVAMDEYGNEFDFYLVADRNPPVYSPDTLNSFTPARAGQIPDGTTPGSQTPPQTFYLVNAQSGKLAGPPAPPVSISSMTDLPSNKNLGDFIYSTANFTGSGAPRFIFDGTRTFSKQSSSIYQKLFDIYTDNYKLYQSNCNFHIVYDPNYQTQRLTLISEYMFDMDAPGQRVIGGYIFPIWSANGVAIAVAQLDYSVANFLAASTDGSGAIVLMPFSYKDNRFSWNITS